MKENNWSDWEMKRRKDKIINQIIVIQRIHVCGCDVRKTV